MGMEYNEKAFGISWLIISVILEIWWLIAVIVSAVKGTECGWEAVESKDWFVLIILILIFFGQFSIGELIGLIDYQKSQNMNIGMFPKWVIIALQFIAGLFLILNILAVANNVQEQSYECYTGQIMLTTVVVNLAYCIVTFIFAFITLPKADTNNPQNQNKKTQIPQDDDEDKQLVNVDQTENDGNKTTENE
eukprot:76854_1